MTRGRSVIRNLCVCSKFEDIGYPVNRSLVSVNSVCLSTLGEYFVTFTQKGRGIASDVALSFSVIRCNFAVVLGP